MKKIVETTFDGLLSHLKITPQFTVMGYADDNGGVSNFRFSLMGYMEAAKKSYGELKNMDTSKFDEIQLQAWEELKSSLEVTLSPTESHKRHKTFEEQGKIFLSPNVSFNPEKGQYHFEGIVTDRVNLVAGEYPQRKSAAKTIEKAKIRRQLTIGKYKLLRLSGEQVEKIIYTPEMG